MDIDARPQVQGKHSLLTNTNKAFVSIDAEKLARPGKNNIGHVPRISKDFIKAWAYKNTPRLNSVNTTEEKKLYLYASITQMSA